MPQKLVTSIHHAPTRPAQSSSASFLVASGAADVDDVDVGIVVEGWGIRIIEGPDWIAMFWCTIAVICMSVVVCGGYLIATGDMQGATGLGAFIMAVWGVLLPDFYLRWSVS